jgi:hypothetical protein
MRRCWFPAIVIFSLAAASVPSGRAAAQSTGEFAGQMLGVLGAAIAGSKLRKIVAELSAPLAFESAAGPIDPGLRNDPRNLDIAGVRLGMTPQEVVRALQAAGYNKDGEGSMQRSYDTLVRDDWARLYGVQTGQAIFVPNEVNWEKQGQTIRITFVALPEGALVNVVDYSATDAPISDATFVSQLQQRYGEPVNEDDADQRWCTVKAPTCEDPRAATYPVLAAWTSNRSLHLVGNDVGRDAALAARFEADVTRRRPASGDASF